MIKIEKEEVCGWMPAIRGMRNPLESWEKSDSFMCDDNTDGRVCPSCRYYRDDESCECDRPGNGFILGNADLALMQKLIKAGSDHSKFMRMITVYCDITAPLYWWKEYDTYKVGTVCNSCSTMHCIHKKKFTLDDFSHEHLSDETVTHGGYFCLSPMECMTDRIHVLNAFREKFIETKDKKWWWNIIQLLPSSYNQKRTVMLNYAVLRNMYHARKAHKLDEWVEFCKWVETLPHSKELICL